MNGIMPGPLWLAIASAANDTTIENRNPTHELKNDTVTGNMSGSQKKNIGGERKAHGDFEKELHPVEHTMERKES